MILVKLARKGLQRLGYDLHRRGDVVLRDADAQTLAIIDRVRPYTVTTPERIFALCEAVRYVTRAGVPGSIVECGVWAGGSMMAVSIALQHLDDPSRDLYLFDTFEGMTEPTGRDIDVDGIPASTHFQRGPRSNDDRFWTSDGVRMRWAAAPRAEVQARLEATGYPVSRLHLVAGPVEETLPANAPADIAVLRLDTDWYESTAHEMVHLLPRLVAGGVLIVDDYGHWRGAREAVDEYLAAHGVHLLLNRIDYSGRAAIMTTTARERLCAGPERAGDH